MEDDQNGRRPKRKLTKMEDDQDDQMEPTKPPTEHGIPTFSSEIECGAA